VGPGQFAEREEVTRRTPPHPGIPQPVRPEHTTEGKRASPGRPLQAHETRRAPPWREGAKLGEREEVTRRTPPHPGVPQPTRREHTTEGKRASPGRPLQAQETQRAPPRRLGTKAPGPRRLSAAAIRLTPSTRQYLAVEEAAGSGWCDRDGPPPAERQWSVRSSLGWD
jgi:hypothetical protein